MKKSLLLIYCVGYLLTACVSSHITWSTHSNMKKVAIGMSKDQVISVLGNDYLVASSSKDERGNNVEVLAYKSDVHEEYRLRFINAQLAEWSREFTNKYMVKDPS